MGKDRKRLSRMFSKAQLFAAVSVLYAVLATGEVVQLTTDTFDGFMKEHNNVLVKFYAPWCGHCKSLAPEYEKASEEVPEGVMLAEVDVTADEAKELGTRFEIKGFPTMKFFRDGEPEDYDGGRTQDTIVQWIKRATSDPVTVMASLEAARKEFSDETLIVGTFKKDSEVGKTFEKVAKANRMLGKFISIEGDLDTVQICRANDEDIPSASITTMDDMKKFISTERLPYFGPVDGSNFSDYMETGLDFLWFAGSKEEMESVKAEMSKIGKDTRGKFNVVWLDSVEYSRQAEGMLGVSEFPALVRTLDGPGRYVFPAGEVTQTSVASWLSDIEDKKIEPTLKSEDIPETNDDAVKVAVGKNFEQIVSDDKDVLLEIYAPWCGHCKKLEPIYTEVAEKVKELSPNTVIAKLDGTANEIPVSGYEFQGFPTLYFKKAGQKPTLYQSGRELDDIMKFLSTESTTKFEYVAGSGDSAAKDEL